MRKIFQSVALTLMFVFTAMNVKAQQVPAVPVDSAVIVGKLDNGLTYYIRHNEMPKGQADFYIAQNVGSILEEDNQRGLAHFLEHMCFNGTKNFPGNGVIDWLETVGVKFGQNLNAYTGIDETVYNISNVPVDRTGVQDSCLMVLHDWSHDLLLTDKDIDGERGVIHEEWRSRMVGEMRIIEKLFPVMYPNCKYGYRLPIGIMDVVDHFDPEALRAYYRKWYRPDLQAIIVVGDIDPAYIEGKIKELFTPIQMPEDPAFRDFEEVDDTPGTIYAIGTDPEMASSEASIMFKQSSPVMTRAQKKTMAYYVDDYVKTVIQVMINDRLSDIVKKGNAPFVSASVSMDKYFWCKTKDALDVSVKGKGNDITVSLAAAYRELLRAARHGFTVTEYERAKTILENSLEQQYNQREHTENGEYAQEYVKNFTDGDPIPGIAFEYELYKNLSSQIDVDVINTVLPEMIDEDNRVIFVALPENSDIVVPTEESLAKMMSGVEAEDIEAFKEDIKAEPLIEKAPKAVKPKSIKDNAQWGAKEITYANGIKVLVKPTSYKADEILLYGSAKGGTSIFSDDYANEIAYLPYAGSQHGLGTYNSIDLKKYLQGKQTSFATGFDAYDRTLHGETTAKNVETLMELIYMTFNGYDITADDFSANQEKFLGLIANQENSPQYIFQCDIMKTIFESKKLQAISTEVIKNADREKTLQVIKSMLSNPGDYTLAFVGDINMDTFLPLLNKYIGSLKKGQSVEFKQDPTIEVKKGAINETFTTTMVEPQLWTFVCVTGQTPYTVKNRIVSDMASQIMSNRLLKKIREEMGATYSIQAVNDFNRTAIMNNMIQIPFPMKPEAKDEALAAIDTIIKEMAENVTDDELSPIKEFMVKESKEKMENNESWAGAMAFTPLNNVDTFTGRIEVINSITVADIQEFIKALSAQGNKATVILAPAE
jgi:zinc protease